MSSLAAQLVRAVVDSQSLTVGPVAPAVDRDTGDDF